MAQRVGKQTLQLEQVYIGSFAAAVGKKEKQGPLGRYFDIAFDDELFGQDSFEKAESFLQRSAVETALKKANIAPQQVQYLFAGDLLNQCIGSTFGLREFGIPFLGMYGACSTMALTLGTAGVFIDGGGAKQVVAATSSHFCSAERQFRFPLEYGGQRPQSAQWTVTGSGAAVVCSAPSPVRLAAVTFGKMQDLNVTDANNMGAAMAPAAADTIAAFLQDTHTSPKDYDLILTGDLGSVGSALLVQLLKIEGVSIAEQHKDCGVMIFNKNQDVHAGGSGCGCSASVLCGYILPKMAKKELKNLLFCATGALMSPTSSMQGESILGVAHLVHLTVE